MVDALAKDAVSILAVAATIAAAWLGGCAVAPRRPQSERLALGLLMLLTASSLLFVQPLAGVSLLGDPWTLRVLLVAALALLAVRARGAMRPHRVPRAALPAAVAGIVLASPLLFAPGEPLPRGDMVWHEGWIRQVAGGLTEPNGLYRDVPNAYPWLYHAFGGLASAALGVGMASILVVLEVVALLALGLGAWLLAGELGHGAAARAWTCLVAVAAGGLEWLFGRESDLGANPDIAFGWLLESPQPSPGLAGVPPPLPRDLGLGILALALWLTVRATGGDRRAAMGAGLALGLTAVTAPQVALAGMAGVVALVVSGRDRRALPVIVAVAGAIAALWAVPLAWHAHELGGLVSTTRNDAVSLGPRDSMVAVGPIVLLAVLGVANGRRRWPEERRVVALSVAALALYAAVVLFEGDFLGTPALAREVRYLPALVLSLAPAAGLGAARLTRRALAVGLAATLLAGPLLAASALTRTLREGSDRPIPCPLPGAVRPGVQVALLPGSPDDEYAQMVLFARSGAWLLYAERPRIRYAEPGVPGQAERAAELGRIAAGKPPAAGVDLVLSPSCSERSSIGVLQQPGG